MHLWRFAPPLHRLCQRTDADNGAFVAGAVRLRSDGRAHLHNAFRYVALNPVRARLVERAADWPWSSTTALITGKDDGVVTVAPVLERTGDFKAFLGKGIDEAAAYAALRKAETIGRPVGDAAWLAALEKRTGRKLIRAKPGRKAKDLKE